MRYSSVRFVFVPSLTLLALFVSWPASGQVSSDTVDIDHAGVIRDWDPKSLARGEAFFRSSCAACHGAQGDEPSHPKARAFGKEAFKFGSDPYSMYRTLTHGAGAMLPQTWLTPGERYDVIHYIRESLMGGESSELLESITETYLDDLPKGMGKGRRSPSSPRDYGPVLASQIERRVNLALTFDLGRGVSMSYDLQRMAVSDVWHGGLDLSQTHHVRLRGERQPIPKGDPIPGLADWYWRLGDGYDPPPSTRHETWIDGSESSAWLPKEQIHFQGHYVFGRNAVLRYTVHGRGVLEMPGASTVGELSVVHHTLRVAPGEIPLDLIAGAYHGDGWPVDTVLPLFGAAIPGGPASAAGSFAIVGGESTDGNYGGFVAAAVVGETRGLSWTLTEDQQLVLTIPPSGTARRLRVFRASGNGAGDLEAFVRHVAQAHEDGQLAVPDLAAAESGGPRLWRDAISMPIRLDDAQYHYEPVDYEADDERRTVEHRHVPYTVDTITLPEPNPWNAWMRMSDLAFFEDGTLAVSTLGGDVWLVSGLDGETATWRRYASGLFEPLGLRVIDGLVYATCRGGIVRLHDLNDDGQADYYENFHPDHEISNGFHGYNFDLQRDDEGYLYYIKPGRFTDYRQAGAVVRVRPDGGAYEIVASGFRVPNGMGRGPDGTLYGTDNQGSWVPANKVNRIEAGNFYGVFQHSKKETDRFDLPMLWLPQEIDNSPGNITYSDDERFGPLAGKLIMPSFGKGWVSYLMPQHVDGVWQGAAVALPFQFRSGTMRAAASPVDGQIYVTGLTGWDTESTQQEGCLQRIRFTGAPSSMIVGARVTRDGVALTFSGAVDAAVARDTANYAVERWNYRRTPSYGSDHYSVSKPDREGHDILDVVSANLDDSARGLRIEIDDMRPSDTLRVRYTLRSARGAALVDTVYFTVHRLPPE